MTLGFLMLTSKLGNLERKPLTPAQLRILTQAVAQSDFSREVGELAASDLTRLGLSSSFAQRIIDLLAEGSAAREYLRRGKENGIYPITRDDPRYPGQLRYRLGADAPGCLWAKGDMRLLSRPGISVVGNRDLKPENLKFAQEAGTQAARQGYSLISGNARGTDMAAQTAALRNGGGVISVVADALLSHKGQGGVLYLAEEDYDEPFSAQRALRRNRVIHALGEACLVAQCREAKGGTWSGSLSNLRNHWTPVYVFSDDNLGTRELTENGAVPVSADVLSDLSQLFRREPSLFDV